MNKLLTGIAVLIGQLVYGQSYDEQLNKAGEALQKKDFCAALGHFKTAFKDSSRVGPYDLAFGAMAATNCNEEKLALSWLRKSQRMGLGSSQGEIDLISSDSGFIKLRSFPEWADIVSDMRKGVVQKEALQAKRTSEWVTLIHKNKINQKADNRFSQANTGFALYYTTVDSLKIPYLVYVPKNYRSSKPIQAIVYLHGGIMNTEIFNFENPDLATGEPIFAVGDSFGAIIIYPFGKKDFGWVAQKKAFENVITITKEVQRYYHIDPTGIFLGGMSNGGTATFWFASKKPNMFKGFYTLSAMPKLEIENIDFKNLGQGKLFYSVHAKDDDVFKYNDVLMIYDANKNQSKDWHFETLETGNHGFIYDPIKGKEILNNLFQKLLVK
jgi:predicted esterase